MSALEDLKTRLADIYNLEMTGALLDWDQQTYMPPGGVAARAEQRTTISKIAHAMHIDSATGRLLEAAERECGDLAADSVEAALLRRARRDFDNATKLPEALVEETARVTALSQDEWAYARAENDYARFAPWLEKIVDLQQRTAEALGYEEKLYDALLDQYEEGMTCSQLDPIFEQLKAATVPLVQGINANIDAVDDALLSRDYDEDLQKEFAEEVLRDCGFDWARGRQDRSVHPFCTNFSQGDVRITTRYNRNALASALFGSMHEMGHGLYEQGIDPAYEGTPLGGGVSLGIHESQSRLWENLVGRSRPFWNKYFPTLQTVFPQALSDHDAETFYRAINRAAPSLIRVEADEVTYNLHIILRYEMENELLEGRLSVADAPEAWNAKMQSYFGLTPPSHAEGILQDVHWSIGAMGYFPTYSLGNIISAQLWEKALQEHPGIPEDIENGEFSALLGWLRQNIHQHGRRYTPSSLVKLATGTPLRVEPYLNYLQTKFGEIYGI